MALTKTFAVAALATVSAACATSGSDLADAGTSGSEGPSSAAIIEGTAEASWAGRLLRCRRGQVVALIPSSEAIDAAVQRAFGDAERGSFTTSDIAVYPFPSDSSLVRDARTTHCGLDRRFRFTDVAPGTYYVTTTLAPVGTGTFVTEPARRFSEPAQKAVSVMRRVQIAEFRSYEVKLTSD